MRIKQNFHIHSHHSCDSASITMADLNSEMQKLGFEHFGVSDHYHTRYNYSDIESSRHDFLGLLPPENFHFGIEVSCMSKWECEKIAAGDYVMNITTPVYGIRENLPNENEYFLDITQEDIDKLGIEYVIGGSHWPLQFPFDRKKLIKDYYEQLIFLASHPLVDIVAHPWWSIEIIAPNKGWNIPRSEYDWEIYKEIPQEYFAHIGEALRDNGKLAEINLGMIFPFNSSEQQTERYLQMLLNWRKQGVKFSLGDDLHANHFCQEAFTAGEAILTNAGFIEEDFALPFKRGNR